LVKVIVNIDWGLEERALISQATLCAITLVLPEPAPAKTSKFDESEVTASLWASLRLFRIFETSTSLFYRRFLKVVS